ncbi:MAG: co-chaperone GroES family protein [Candidatus Omnitrophica bacterium]|nr:co-chaperone GroES family protein [Candidatus Omnitrophota bacterium]
MKKELIIVGDKVLILPDEGTDRTESGLYLPQGVKEKEKVQSGIVVKTGPGYIVPDPTALDIEPWQAPKAQSKYIPLQAKEGDYCIFLRSSGVEIEYEQKKYVVVPHSAILVLLRNPIDNNIEDNNTLP